jgi:hypothetical protein
MQTRNAGPTGRPMVSPGALKNAMRTALEHYKVGIPGSMMNTVEEEREQV